MFLCLGCSGGPFAELAGLNPWIWKKWEEDERYGPTFHRRLAELKSLQANASRLSPDERQGFAQQLVELVQNDPHPFLRAEAVKAMAKLSTPAVLPGLRAAAADTDPLVRAAACRAWGGVGDAEALHVLGDLATRDADVDVRVAATGELGRFRDQAAVQALGLVLNDNDPAVQYQAVKSLKSATGRDLGDSVAVWRDYVAGRAPLPERSPSLVERFRSLF